MKRNTFPEKPTTLSNFPFSFGLGGTCLLQIYLAGTSFLDPPIYFIFSLLIEKKNLDQKDLYIYIIQGKLEPYKNYLGPYGKKHSS